MHPVRNGSFHHYSFLFFPFFPRPRAKKEIDLKNSAVSPSFFLPFMGGGRKLARLRNHQGEKKRMLHLQRNAKNAHQPRRDGGRDELYGLLAGRRRKKKREGRASFCPSEWKYWHGNRRRLRMKKRRGFQTMNGLPPPQSVRDSLSRLSLPPSLRSGVCLNIYKQAITLRPVSLVSFLPVDPANWKSRFFASV